MKNREKRKCLLLYSVLFLVMAGIIFSAFLIKGKTLLYSVCIWQGYRFCSMYITAGM